MLPVAFPALKIMLLMVKQLAKPIATYVKTKSKTHPLIRSNIVRFAQSYHRLEIRLKRRQLDAGKPSNSSIQPLEEQRAIDLAANFIGETIIFSTAVAVVLIESYRKRLDDKEKNEARIEEIQELQSRISELELRLSGLQRTLPVTTVVVVDNNKNDDKK